MDSESVRRLLGLIIALLVALVASQAFGLDMKQRQEKLIKRSIKELKHFSVDTRLEAIDTLEGFEATRTIVSLLIERGAGVNVRHDGGLNTPLMFALSRCDAEVVRLLLEAGADPEIRNKFGQNAYASCLLYKNDGVEALLETGYRLQPKDYEELTRIYGDEPGKLTLIKRAAPR